MKEIGGYIEFEYFHGKEYHENAIKLNCGRNCLAYLIEAYKIEKIYLPYFLCSSVKNVCDKYSIDIEYYHINERFEPIIPKSFENNGWFYLVNYYGQLSKKKIIEIKKTINNIIVDNAQAFFSQPIDEIPTIYTCRKFFGVSDGAYLCNSSIVNRSLEQDLSYDRMLFLLGRFEKSANEFYPYYSANNRQFIIEEIKIMSKITENILKSLDYEYIRKRRTDNFDYLKSKLNGINKLEISSIDGAFAYPLYLSNADEIRKKLQSKKVYIPTLWPDVFDICDKSVLEYSYAKNILPIPVDQRYGVEDMEYICELISEGEK